MPKVKIINTGKVVEVTKNTLMRNVLIENGGLIGCKSGLCGVCCIEIISGEENLSPKSNKEIKRLISLNAGNHLRLGCQCIIYGDCSIKLINTVG